MPKFVKTLLSTFLVILVCFSTGFTDAARYSNESMAVGGGARALALGGAYTALANDAWSLFWNPSGLISVDRSQAGLMHSERFGGVVDYDAAAYATPRPDGSVWSAGLLRLGVNGVPFTKLENPKQPHSEENRVVVDKYVNEGEYTFFIAQAKRYKRWRWGIAPKLLFRHFGSEYRAYGLGIDVGAGGRPLPNIPVEAGVTIRDLLGTVLAWEQTGRKEVIAPTVRIGLASVIELPKLEATLSPSVDIVYRTEVLGDSDATALHAGFEYLVRKVVALRLGSDDGRWTLGGGLELKPVSIAYAFVGHDDLGDTHRISVTTRWGSRLSK